MPSHRLPDGARLAWEERPGAGPPVVLLHGVLDGAHVWRRVADALERAGRRTVVVHARGHGASEPWRPGMAWSPRADAQDVASLLRAVAPDGAHLAGHSRGATSACWIAAESPELARSLAAICTPPQPGEAFRAAFRKRLAAAADARERDAYAYLSGIVEDDFPMHLLRRYDRPALVVEAGDDPLYSPTDTLFWRAFLPYARFERVEGGHRFFADDDVKAAWLASRILDVAREGDGDA